MSCLMLLSAAVLVGLIAQPGAAVNVPQPVVVSSNLADWTPHVLDGRSPPSSRSGTRSSPGPVHPGGQRGRADHGHSRSNIFAFDTTTGAIDTAFGPVLDAQVESLTPAPDGLHVLAGGSFIRSNGGRPEEPRSRTWP